MSMAKKSSRKLGIRYPEIGIMLIVIFCFQGICGASATSGDAIKCGIALIEAAEFEKSRDIFEGILQHDLDEAELQATYICLAMIEVAFNRKDKAGDIISELIKQFTDINIEDIHNNKYVKGNYFLVSDDFKEIFNDLMEDVSNNDVGDRGDVVGEDPSVDVDLVDTSNGTEKSEGVKADNVSGADSSGVKPGSFEAKVHPTVRPTSRDDLKSVENESKGDPLKGMGMANDAHTKISSGDVQSLDPVDEKNKDSAKTTSEFELKTVENASKTDPGTTASNIKTAKPEIPRGDFQSKEPLLDTIDFGIVKEEGVEIEKVVTLPDKLGLNTIPEYVQTELLSMVEFRNIGIEDLFYVEVSSQSKVVVLFKVPPFSELENGLYKGALKFRDKDGESNFAVGFTFDLSL